MKPLIGNRGPLALLVAAGCVSAVAHQLSRQFQVTPATLYTATSACQVQRADALINGRLSIRPGETLCVQVQTQGDSIIPIALISDATAGTLVLTLRRDGGNSTTLTVQNSLPLILRYQASIRIAGKTDREPTNTCPVLSQRFAVESWPYPVQEVILTDFKVAAQAEAATCN